MRRCVSFAGLGPAALLVALFVVAGSAQAAFPGRDGLLAVQPLKGRGVVLVGTDGRGERRICATPATGARACSLMRPEWSPAGRSLAVEVPLSEVAAGRPVAVIYPDGSCLECVGPGPFVPFALGEFPVALADAAFTSTPTLLTAVVPPEGPGSPSGLYTFGVDGLVKSSQALIAGAVSDPVWSSRGKLALVRSGWIWAGRPHSLHRLLRGSDPSWSPGGSRIVFDRNGWLMVRRLRGRTARRLVRGSAPAWSPNGRWIAFIADDHRLSVVHASGGRVRRVGGVTGATVDWQPLPANPPAACLTPPGSTVLASSDAATVSIDTTKFGTNPPVWAAIGCVLPNGRQRVLASYSLATEGSPTVTGAVLSGTLAALELGQSGVNCGPSITVYDLQSGKSSDYYDNTRCGVGIDPLLLEANGFAAWLVTGSDASEQLYAHDSHGTRTVDSAPAGSGTAIADVQLTGDQLTWTHNGTPRQLTLH